MTQAAEIPSAAQCPYPASVTPATAAEIKRYESRYAAFFDEIRRDLDELRRTGAMSRARDLSEATGRHFNHTTHPDFFFGDLDASFVVVHLNPKQADSSPSMSREPLPVQTFEEHFDAHRHFGARNYGGPHHDHTSPFDHKQIRFLRPFNVIDFIEERKKEDRFTNLERVIDRKLQLELVPYGSDEFSLTASNRDVLKPHFARVMRTIAAKPRAYVIFCGAVFARLLPEGSIVEPEYKVNLWKADGSKEKQLSRFARLRLPYGDATIEACLAHSWARQGIPMGSYADKIRVRYGNRGA
jgi:hypothetical protein